MLRTHKSFVNILWDLMQKQSYKIVRSIDCKVKWEGQSCLITLIKL